MRRVLLLTLVAGLLAGGCQRPLPGERPGPDHPTIGPTFPFQPQNRHFIIGTLLRNADGAVMAGRIGIYADAVDSAGGRGRSPKGKSYFPIETIVDSNWKFPFDIPFGYELDVNITMDATAFGLEPGERIESYIVEDTGLNYIYYDQKHSVAPRVNPHQPLHADCFVKIVGVPK